MGGFLGVVALVLAGVLATTRLSETPLPVRRAAPSTPSPANLPITAPPGYQVRAVWATEVADTEETGVVLLPGGQVAMLAGDDRLEVRDASTGVLRWETELSSSMVTEGALRLTRMGGELVLTASDTTSLQYWELDEEHTAGRVTLPQGSTEVTFHGGSPLVSLSDQTAGYVDGGEVRLVDVPVGATAVSSDGSQVLAVDGSGRFWRLRSGQEVPPEPERLEPPAKDADLLSATGLPNGMFAAAWQHGTERLAILSESPGGEELAREELEYDDSYQEPVPDAAEEDDVAIVSSDDGDVVVVDDAVFFTRAEAALRVSGLTVGSVSGGHVYGTDSTGKWFDVTVTGRERVAGKESAPVAVDEAGAFVVTTKLGKELLYLLPPLPQSTPQRHGERKPTPTADGDR